MNNIGTNAFDIGYLDTLAGADSPVHRLDPRAKLLTTAAFIVSVVSFDKYALSGLTPFFIYPAVLLALSGLPVRYVLRKAAMVSLFAVLIAMFNPLLDRDILFHLGPIGITGGWVSFVSILIRLLLTVTAAFILIASTGFNALCESLRELGVPRPFVAQLLFFYRYLFVLTDEAERLVRAWSLRAFNAGAMRGKVFIPLIGHLLLRTLDRAERIYRAMLSRGFDGHFRIMRTLRIRSGEIVFLAGWILLFVFLRCVNMPLKLGALLRGVSP